MLAIDDYLLRGCKGEEFHRYGNDCKWSLNCPAPDCASGYVVDSSNIQPCAKYRYLRQAEASQISSIYKSKRRSTILQRLYKSTLSFAEVQISIAHSQLISSCHFEQHFREWLVTGLT